MLFFIINDIYHKTHIQSIYIYLMQQNIMIIATTYLMTKDHTRTADTSRWTSLGVRSSGLLEALLRDSRYTHLLPETVNVISLLHKVVEELLRC